jgi:hypothetical protein
MTTSSLITLNSVLGAVLVFAVVRLLAHGIFSGRRAEPGPGRVEHPRAAERDRLAA